MIEGLPRREMLALAGAAALAGGAAGAAPRRTAGELLAPVPTPRQAPQREGLVDVPGAKLYYWDTGGSGQPVVLGHPGTGSALIWDYQQPVLAAAGFRVVGYSRRGHARSQVVDAKVHGSDVADLDALADRLQLGRFHALGSAAGGGVMLDYALARPQRLRSLIVSGSIGNLAEPEYRRRSAALRPEGFERMPAEFRELGPCYRAADPAGTARWITLERQARTVPMAPPPPPPPDGGPPRPGWAELARLPMPVLWMTGDADLYTPPPLLVEFHRRLPASEMLVIDGAGHSAYWEQPARFNAGVIDFLRRRAR